MKERKKLQTKSMSKEKLPYLKDAEEAAKYIKKKQREKKPAIFRF